MGTNKYSKSGNKDRLKRVIQNSIPIKLDADKIYYVGLIFCVNFSKKAPFRRWFLLVNRMSARGSTRLKVENYPNGKNARDKKGFFILFQVMIYLFF